ncbi:MAG: signal peptidase I [Treponema sp.]|jgi:signal peptidase I|nr:signal peptidase I [Treponema sp.]
MFNKWLKYSYAAQKDQRYRVRWVIVWIMAVFFLYLLLTTFVFSVRRLEAGAMQPELHAGDRIIFSSRMLYRFLPDEIGAARLRRGNIVLVDTTRGKPQGVIWPILDTVVRFFTAQQIDISGRAGNVYVKRVIGLPGDEITITNFVARVKPAGGAYSFTEFELWDRPYSPNIPQVPALWDSSLPFSGNMETITLGEDECFVLSDDRGNTNDSRTWGPIPMDYLTGRALFRYWPPTRIGLP